MSKTVADETKPFVSSINCDATTQRVTVNVTTRWTDIAFEFSSNLDGSVRFVAAFIGGHPVPHRDGAGPARRAAAAAMRGCAK